MVVFRAEEQFNRSREVEVGFIVVYIYIEFDLLCVEDIWILQPNQGLYFCHFILLTMDERRPHLA